MPSTLNFPFSSLLLTCLIIDGFSFSFRWWCGLCCFGRLCVKHFVILCCGVLWCVCFVYFYMLGYGYWKYVLRNFSTTLELTEILFASHIKYDLKLALLWISFIIYILKNVCCMFCLLWLHTIMVFILVSHINWLFFWNLLWSYYWLSSVFSFFFDLFDKEKLILLY